MRFLRSPSLLFLSVSSPVSVCVCVGGCPILTAQACKLVRRSRFLSGGCCVAVRSWNLPSPPIHTTKCVRAHRPKEAHLITLHAFHPYIPFLQSSSTSSCGREYCFLSLLLEKSCQVCCGCGKQYMFSCDWLFTVMMGHV